MPADQQGSVARAVDKQVSAQRAAIIKAQPSHIAVRSAVHTHHRGCAQRYAKPRRGMSRQQRRKFACIEVIAIVERPGIARHGALARRQVIGAGGGLGGHGGGEIWLVFV